MTAWTAIAGERRWSIVLTVLTLLAGFLALLPAGPALAVAPASDELVGVAPFRAADTRDGTGGRLGALGGQEWMAVSVTGAGVPAGAKAVSLNVTVTQPQGAGYVTAYPCGRSRPFASNLNFTRGLTIANAVISGVGAGDSVCFFSSVPTHLIVDVNGFLPADSTYQPVTPYRVTDTRITQLGPMVAGQTGRKIVAPAGEWAAVALNVTAVDPGGAGFVTVYPCGTERPTASNLNFVRGQTVPNAVVSAVGASNGGVCFYTSASTHLVIDVVGHFPAGAKFAAGVPERVLDSRWPGRGLVRAGETIRQQVAPPGEAVAVAMNVTVTDTRGPGFLTVYPCSVGRPLASNLNFTRGKTVPNMVWSPVDAEGRVCLYTSQATHLIVDVTGSFRNISPPGPVTALTVGTRTGTSIALSWTNPGDLDLAAVAVRRAAGSVPPSSRGSGTEVRLASPTATSVTDTGLTSDTQYSYAIFTTDTAGNENRVPATVVTRTLDTAPPGRVTGLTAAPASPSSIRLSWTNPPDTDLAEVIVRRAPGSSAPSSATAGSDVPLASPTATSVTDTGLASGTTYAYAVFSRDGAGNLQPTPATVTATTIDGTPPGPVTALSATATTASTVALSWTNPSDADLAEVVVRRATGSTAPSSATSGTGVSLAAATANSVTDTGLSPATTYSYAVFTRDTAGNTTSSGAVVTVATLAEQELLKVTSGAYHSCGLDAPGSAWCWGYNAHGQLGDGTATGRTTPTPVSGGRAFTQISAGTTHTCALDTAGKAWCWGQNSSGQLGTGGTSSASSPVAVSGGRTFGHVDAGGSSTCAVDVAGQAWCWGANSAGQLGNTSTSTAVVPTAVSQGSATLRSVSVGTSHACGLDLAGKAWCWGSNLDGRLGDTTESNRYAPTAVSTSRVFAQIDAGGMGTCAVDAAGRAWCWGYNGYGQLGTGGTSTAYSPVAVAQGSLVLRSVALGTSHACAVDDAGKAWCWGSGVDGRLGNGSTSTRYTPSAVSGPADYAQIAAGGATTCGRTIDDQVRCWGDNGFGQLGDGTTAVRYTPVNAALASSDEAGDSRADARTVPLPFSIAGRITSGDEDWYRLTTIAAGTLTASLSGLGADLDLSLYDVAGNRLASSTADGAASETVSRALAAGTYYVAVVPFNGALSNYTLAVSHTAAADTTPPGPVENVVWADADVDAISLSWTNPTDPDFAEVIVRSAEGRVAPTSPTAGVGVTLSGPKATSVLDSGLTAWQYSYAFFTRDASGNVSPTPVTVTANAV